MRRRSFEEINKKCELLESLGFEIQHQDSSVTYHGQEFDLSAVACDPKSIMHAALEAMYQHGREQGQEFIRTEFRELLGLK